MTHTHPDYSTKQKMATIYGEVNNAELAARIWSINTFDRRGHVVWMDDFEHGLEKWLSVGAGLGNTQTITADRARNGDSSAKLVCGSTLVQSAGLHKRMMLPVASALGFECSFSLQEDLDYITLSLNSYDGTNLSSGQIMIDYTNNRIRYLNAAGGQTDLITAITWNNLDDMFYTIKFVCDYTAIEYVRFIFGNTTVDMAGVGMSVAANATYPRLDIFIDAIGDAAKNAEFYVDDVIITQNEP